MIHPAIEAPERPPTAAQRATAPSEATPSQGLSSSRPEPLKGEQYGNLDSILGNLVAQFERDGKRNLGGSEGEEASTGDLPAPEAAAKEAGGGRGLTWAAPVSKGEQVAVIFRMADARQVEELARFLQDKGGDPRNQGQDYIEAYVPIPLLDEASRQSGVIRVEAIVPPEPALGPITSEGAAVHRAPPWNAAGFTGRGIKVGLIDSGFRRFEELMGTELPTEVRARCYTEVGRHTSNLRDCEVGGVHGTAVAESLVDIAPEVQLYITQPASQADAQSAVDWMLAEGVDVINQSLIWVWDGPGDGTSPNDASLLNTVDRAVAGGVFWSNSSGNGGREHWLGPFVDGNGDGWHDFEVGKQRCNGVTVQANKPILVQLRWDDSWTRANRNLDLHLVSADGSEELASKNIQNGQAGQQPYESISARASRTEAACLSVRHISGSVPSWMQLNIMVGAASELDYYTSGSMSNPGESANPGLLAVGAAAHFSTQRIEDFSGQGPTPDGRIKPDLVGADRGRSSAFFTFPGTSQSSPHIAGLGALIRSAYPSLTPSQVADYLKANAQDRGDPGPDNVWGHGFVELPAAPRSADLASLRLSQGALSPTFSRDVVDYAANIDNAVARLTITATAAQASASIQILPTDADSVAPGHQIDLGPGSNDILVRVTGTDGARKTYRIGLVRGSTSVDLSELRLSRGELDPAFSSGTTAYSAQVGRRLTATRLTVTATPRDGNAGVHITPADLDPDMDGHQVALSAGDNLIDIAVTAPDGGATKTYRVTVNRAATPANQAPTAHAGLDQAVMEESQVTLDGSASSDPENQRLTFAWRQRSGPEVTLDDPGAENPFFKAPNRLDNYDLTFALTVHDGAQNSVIADTVTIAVSADNDPPEANAGRDSGQSAGATVTLVGEGSVDPEGQPLTYAWRLESQSAGPPVALNDIEAPNPTFTAPAADGTLVFSLRVNDGVQDSVGDDTVTITVGSGVTDHDKDDDGLIDLTTPAQLHAVRWDLDGNGAPESNASDYAAAFAGWAQGMGCRGGTCVGYELAADLDLNLAPYNRGEGWTPIGFSATTTLITSATTTLIVSPTSPAVAAHPFSAIFKGNNHTIANLFIRRTQAPSSGPIVRPTGLSVGLFARLGREGRIDGVGLVNANVTGGARDNDVGSLVGLNEGAITASYATGAVTGTGTPNTSNTGRGVGGLVGRNRQGAIAASYATAAVAGLADVGGLVGKNILGRIVASYATGAVMGRFAVGGLVGVTQGGTIAASYATGIVSGHDALGGLVAISTSVLVFETRVILPVTIINSYWDIQTTGQSSGQGGVGKSTQELQAPGDYRGIYADWNLDVDGSPGADRPWRFGESDQYPVLQQGGMDSAAQFAAQKPFTDADLRTLAIADGTLGAAFQSAVATHVVSLDESASHLEIVAQAKWPSAQIAIVPGDADSAVDGHQVDLDGDFATVAIGVTAADGGITKSYLLRAVRGNHDRDGDGLIEMSDAAQLNAIRWDLYTNGAPSQRESDYAAAFSSPISGARCPTVCFGYALVADLDLNQAPFNVGLGWDPIGRPALGIRISTSSPVNLPAYQGIFQGNGHSISNLFINRPDDILVGLFGLTTRETRIEGLTLNNVNITGNDRVGGLVASNGGTIAASEVNGIVRGRTLVGGLTGENFATIFASKMAGVVQGQSEVGGLVGRNQATISASQTIGNVRGTSQVGGLAGSNFATLTASYAAGAVRGTSQVGGLTGNHTFGSVSASYATGDVRGTSEVGGLAGRVTTAAIRASYAVGTVAGEAQVGGLVGRTSDVIINNRLASVVDSYWDIETTGQPESLGGVGKTTRELQVPDTYTGIYANWNLNLDGVSGADDPWHFGTSRQYPALKYRRAADAIVDQFNAQGSDDTVNPFNEPPQVVRALEDISLRHGEETEINLAGVFRDPEGASLTYRAESDNPDVVAASLQGSSMRISARLPGLAKVTVTATDPEGSSGSLAFVVTVGGAIAFAGDASAPEGSTARLFVELSGPLAKTLAVNYRVGLDGNPATADADEDDHEGRDGVLTIPPGEIRAAIEIPILDDQDIEPPRERFLVTLEAPESAANVGLGRPATATVIIEEGVCDRTAGVRDGLRGTLDCARLTGGDLAARASLMLSGRGIEALRARDFLGLSGLRALHLSDNRLARWPMEAFAGLPELVSLRLNGNRLRELPAGAFATQPALVGLHLANNQLSELPAGLFAGLPALRVLNLSGNAFSELPSDAFAGLSGLRWLHLQGNSLAALPEHLFKDMEQLRSLHLHGNRLAALPADIFAGLAALEEMQLQDNPGAPFVLGVEAKRMDAAPAAAGPAQLALTVNEGAPFPISAKLSATGGVLSTAEVLLAKGQTSSGELLTVAQDGAVAVVAMGVSAVPQRSCGEYVSYPCYQGLATEAGDPLVLFNAAPAAVGEIGDRTALAEEEARFDLSALFADAEGDSLTYEAHSSDPALARVRIEGGFLLVMPLAEGDVRIRLTATDEQGRSVTQSFVMRIEPMVRSHWRGWRTVLLRLRENPDGS